MKSARSAFTLIELLVVLALIGTLMVMIVPSLSSIMQSTSVAQGGQILADQIALARQMASARSVTTEVRLIELKDHTANGYHAVQIWGASPSGEIMALSRLVKIPDSVVISKETSTYSPMLSLMTNTGTLTVAGASSPYVSFRIRPSGTVVPTPAESQRRSLSLSVVPSAQADGSDVKNYITVQLNPDTGNTTIYRLE